MQNQVTQALQKKEQKTAQVNSQLKAWKQDQRRNYDLIVNCFKQAGVTNGHFEVTIMRPAVFREELLSQNKDPNVPHKIKIAVHFSNAPETIIQIVECSLSFVDKDIPWGNAACSSIHTWATILSAIEEGDIEAL